MVILGYRPYLFALLGLTVCVSLYEIAYVQRDEDEISPSRTVAGNVHIYKSPELLDRQPPHTKPAQNAPLPVDRTGVQPQRQSSVGDGAEEVPPYRMILSSGRLGQDPNGDEIAPTIISQSLPKDDYRNLIDIKEHFSYLINQKPCPKSVTTVYPNGTVHTTPPELLVLVLVHSAPHNFKKRLTIRHTWGSNPDPGMKIYFMLGAVDSPMLQYKLDAENDHFGDLIQGNFTDTYRNMTYKHVMALKWFSYNCAETPIMLKTDDDVFVNTISLMEYVRGNVDNVRKKRRLVKCKVVYDAQVKRSYRSKWRVSTKEYPKSTYPPYCPGFIVLYSADIVPLLYREAQLTKYFWIDDVHVTGTLMQQLNASLTPFRDVYFKHEELHRLTEPYVRNMPLFTSPDLTEKRIRRMWLIAAGEEDERMHQRFLADSKALPFLLTETEESSENGAAKSSSTLGMGAVIVFVGGILLELGRGSGWLIADVQR